MCARVSSPRWLLSIALLILALPSALTAQTASVTGKVIDRATRQPIADAQVVVPGTALVTQSNREGDYRLSNVPAGRVSVGVFKIGYKAVSDTVRLLVGQTATMNLEMAASLVTLSEVVVTGTAGNQERRAQSAQVASVNAAQITRDAPVSTVAELLQSRVPGVAVSTNSGSAGAAKIIRIRGAASINLSNQPLLFIDGIRINEGILASGQSGQSFDRLNDINPDEIESVELVKGPAAATLYGADASAGVIQIITKKGRPGANRFSQSLRLEGGDSKLQWTPPDNYGLCNTAALIATTSTNPLCRGQALNTLVHDNPLQRVGAFQTGKDRQIGWNGRGGGQSFGYNLSYGSEATAGTLPNNQFERYNVRSNFNYIPDSRVTIEAGLGLAQTKTDLPDNDNNIFGWLGGALLGDPRTRSDALAASNDGWYGFNRHYAAINAREHSLLTHRVTTNLSANYLPIPWFTNRVTLGMDYAQDEQTDFSPKNDSTWYGGLTDGGSNQQTSRGAERYTVDYLGNVRRTFGGTSQWESNLSFGLQVISSRNKATLATGIGLVTNDNRSVSSAATTTGGGTFTEQRSFGYLGQLQLGYQNRAFVQFGVRVDKNSAFGNTAPAFVLPKVGGTWTISEERFFNPLTRYVNTLRVRGAWGSTGRSPAPGDALTTLVATPFNITGTTNAGAIPGNPGNDSLKAERGVEYELGADAGFWNDRISTELTYFHKVTNDLIIARPIPPSLGFNANPLANIGQVVNSGLEMQVSVNALRMRNFEWDIRASGNTLRNELTSLGGVPSFNLGSQRNRAVQGQQLGVFMSKKIQTIDVANSRVTVSDTLVPMGNILPTFEWNLSNTFTVMKNLRITGSFDSKRDFEVFNNTQFFRETQLVRSNLKLDKTVLSREEFLRRYGDDTPGRPAFVTTAGNAATVNDVYDAFIQNGDFVRLRELSFAYDVPARLLNNAGGKIQGLTITLAMQNVKMWTRYGGADPEVVSNPNGLGGGFNREDFLTLPNARKTLLRLSVSF
ncbi:MAG: putative outer membrane protein [Gemmatimonadetes bacterium]|nr:putative outer membrane protein [Gemmatimonadota bacterium]